MSSYGCCALRHAEQICRKSFTLACPQPQIYVREVTPLPGGMHNVSSTAAYAVQIIP